MTRPASAPDLDDVVIDQRLVDEKLVEAGAAWEATATALLRVLGIADAFGLLPAEREALDVALVQAARVAARGQSVAFHAGLRIGAAHRDQLAPCANERFVALSIPATDRPTPPAAAGGHRPQRQSTR